MENRWAILIDIEGFSALYPSGDAALWALRQLMVGIHRIGDRKYTKAGERLFAHQLGDGFLIASDFHEEYLDRPINLAIVLMRFITNFKIYSRSTIAEGGLSGITGCYDKEVMDRCVKNSSSTAVMGEGLMTIFPVMGTALINSIRLDKAGPKGPLLLLDKSIESRIKGPLRVIEVPYSNLISVDWINSENEIIHDISNSSDLDISDPITQRIRLDKYCEYQPVPKAWLESCETYLRE
jgi:hypothetical protein